MKGIRLLSVVMLVLCCGCGAREDGPPVAAIDSQASEVLVPAVDDVFSQVNSIWPSVNTTFVIPGEPTDPFGVALVGELREYGYAISENTDTENGVNLAYSIDSLDGEYLVGLALDSSLLTRSYVLDNGQLLPSGLWTRRE